MRVWFKYGFGYVMIDAENIYLCNTGNWSEITELTEKTKKTRSGNDFRKTCILIFLVACGILFGYLILTNIIAGKMSALIIIGLPVLTFYLYNYMKTEIGPKYLIPLKKLAAIEFEEKNVRISFTNGENKEDTELLKNIDEKGFEILKKLLLSKSLQIPINNIRSI